MSDVMIASVYSEKTRLKKLMKFIITITSIKKKHLLKYVNYFILSDPSASVHAS